MPRTTTRRAAVYARISKDIAGTSLGVQRQVDECRALAERLGWSVVGEPYVDNDLSATTGKTRPAYLRMLEDMRAGRVDAVLAWHTDRLTRQPRELETLIDVAEEHGVVFSTCKAGELDLSTSSGQFVARLLGAAARHEAMLKGERQKAQLRQRARAGLSSGGGSRPFGYERGGMELRATEAAVVRELVGRAIAGESLIGLAEWLTAAGVPTVTGKAWHPTVVRQMLTSPRIAGLVAVRGEVVGEAQWPGIIDAATHRRVVEVLAARSRARTPRAHVALLPGLIWCGKCGFELVTFNQQRPGGKKVRSYACRTRYIPGRPGHLKSCGGVSVRAADVETDVAERLLSYVIHPKQRRRLAAEVARRGAGGADAAAVQLREAEERLRELGVDYASRRIGRTEFLAARDHLDAEIVDLQRLVGEPTLQIPSHSTEGLAAWWESATLSEQQVLLRQSIKRIEVGPHSGSKTRYDRTRLRVYWR